MREKRTNKDSRPAKTRGSAGKTENKAPRSSARFKKDEGGASRAGARFKKDEGGTSPRGGSKFKKDENSSSRSGSRFRKDTTEAKAPSGSTRTYGKPRYSKDAKAEHGREFSRKPSRELPFETGETREARNVIYGRHPVLEAIKNGSPLNKAWILENSKNLGQVIDLLKENDIPYKISPKEVLDKIAGNNVNHQGVVAEIAGKEYADFSEFIELSKTKQVFFVILDKLEDPHNLGAIIRTADAAGADGIIIPKHRAVGLTGSVAKTSAGALERMKVCRVTNLTQAMDTLKENNVWLAGIDMDGSEVFTEANLKGSVAVVVGGEGKGLSKSVKDQCDFVVKIPMTSGANSLNASVATALVMYEVYRQRGFGK